MREWGALDSHFEATGTVPSPILAQRHFVT
jgi:hypothetical protein